MSLHHGAAALPVVAPVTNISRDDPLSAHVGASTGMHVKVYRYNVWHTWYSSHVLRTLFSSTKYIDFYEEIQLQRAMCSTTEYLVPRGRTDYTRGTCTSNMYVQCTLDYIVQARNDLVMREVGNMDGVALLYWYKDLYSEHCHQIFQGKKSHKINKFAT